MAVTRPLKEGSVTTYQAKVAAGFPDILASEMDADLDTIYAAWNGGVGTANLANGSVTVAKLDPTLQTWQTGVGNPITPIDGTKTVTLAPVAAALVWGIGTAKSRLIDTGSGAQRWVYNVNAATTVVDDVTKPQWIVSPGDTDCFTLYRSPAGSTPSFANLLQLNASGQLLLPATGGTTVPQVVAGSGTVKAAFWADTSGQAGIHSNNGYAPQDTTKSSWLLYLSSAADAMGIARRAANAGTGAYTTPLSLDGAGNLTILGATATKASGTTWANPSDPRLKDDVAPYARGLAEIRALEPITYRLKAQADGPTCYGFDAAQVRDVFPECVAESRMKLDPEDEEETDGVLTFDMHPILVALVNAVKELAAR